MRTPYGLELVESCVTCKLRKDNFFCSLSHSLLPVLDSLKLANVFPKATVLFAAGQKPAGIHIVCAGKVKLCTDGANGTSLTESIADPAGPALERLWDQEWEKNLMDAAIARVKRRAGIEQFQIFDFYVLKNWPVTKVARTLGVSVGRVYLAKHRVGKLIRKEVAVLQSTGL